MRMSLITSSYWFLFIGFALQATTRVIGDNDVTIGESVYTKMLFRNVLAIHRMVVDRNDNVFYITNDFKMFFIRAGSTEATMVEGLHSKVVDMVMDHDEVIWIGTHGGVYMYDYTTNTGDNSLTKNFNIAVYHMTIGGKGDNTVYLSDNLYNLYAVHQNTIRRIEVSFRVYTVAMNSVGDLYFTNDWNSREVLRLKSGLTGQPEKVADIPDGGVFLLEVDRRNNDLYVCHSTGLYNISPKSKLTIRVNGVNGVSGIAFDRHSNMYLGTDSTIVKMTLSNSDHTERKSQLTLSDINKQYSELLAKLKHLEESNQILMNNIKNEIKELKGDLEHTTIPNSGSQVKIDRRYGVSDK